MSSAADFLADDKEEEKPGNDKSKSLSNMTLTETT